MAKTTKLSRYVGKRITAIREGDNGRKMSQSYLAKKLRINQNEVSRWESGVYMPKIPDLIKLAKFFNVSVLFFLPDDARGSFVSMAEDEATAIGEAPKPRPANGGEK